MEDPERLPTVDDRRDIDDNSMAVMRIRFQESLSKRISVAHIAQARETDTDEVSTQATERINMADLRDVVLEVNHVNLSDKGDLTNIPHAVLGSWHLSLIHI